MDGSECGAPSSNTELGPPERMMPSGSIRFSASGVTSNRTIELRTWCSRTRRAISCVYCPPKSRITMPRLDSIGRRSLNVFSRGYCKHFWDRSKSEGLPGRLRRLGAFRQNDVHELVGYNYSLQNFLTADDVGNTGIVQRRLFQLVGAHIQPRQN